MAFAPFSGRVWAQVYPDLDLRISCPRQVASASDAVVSFDSHLKLRLDFTDDRERARRAWETQRDVQDTLNQIADHRNETQAEIRNDQYLNMTSQEEYVNPYTGKVDTASNQWSHRWVNDRGDEFYTDYESTDPNSIQALRYAEWKRTPVRPRGPADS